MAGAMWNCCCLSLCHLCVLCTPYNHAPCHITSCKEPYVLYIIYKIYITYIIWYVCLAVTCHLRLWQNNQDIFTCYRGNTVVKRIPKLRVSAESWPWAWRRKLSRTLDLFDHESGTLTTKLSRLLIVKSVSCCRLWWECIESFHSLMVLGGNKNCNVCSSRHCGCWSCWSWPHHWQSGSGCGLLATAGNFCWFLFQHPSPSTPTAKESTLCAFPPPPPPPPPPFFYLSVTLPSSRY